MKGYLYVLGTVLFTVYGHVILKWQANTIGPFPSHTKEQVQFLFHYIINPWVISSIAVGFLAFLCWIGALTKLDLSHAYPFMSLSFVLVLFFSALFFHEPLSVSKILGVLFILMGVIVGSQG